MDASFAELEAWWDSFPVDPRPDRQRPQTIVRTVFLVHGTPLGKDWRHGAPVQWSMHMHAGLAELATTVDVDVAEDRDRLVLRQPMSKLGPQWFAMSDNALSGFSHAVQTMRSTVKLDTGEQRVVLEDLYERCHLGPPTVDPNGYWLVGR